MASTESFTSRRELEVKQIFKIAKNENHFYQKNHIAIGQTELNQLYYYLQNSIKIDTFLPQTTSHHFFITVSTRQCTTFIRLEDQRGISHRIGGASFRTVVHSDHYLFACPYVDYTNGTFDVICETNTGFRHNITLILTYLDFGAFRWDGVFINDTLWHGQVLANDCEPLDKASYVGWYRDNNQQSWRWITKNTEILSSKELRACIKTQLSAVEMFGECHLEIAFQYLLFLFDKLTPDIVTYKVLPGAFLGYKFKRAAFMLHENDIPGFVSDKNSMLPRIRERSHGKNISTALPELRKWQMRFKMQILNNKKLPGAKINYNAFQNKLVIQFGHWDLAYRHIKYFIRDTLPAFDSFLQNINADPDFSQVKIIVWGPPAVKEMNITRDNSSEKWNLLNNAILAAANELLKETLRPYKNVLFLDHFTIVFCREDDGIDSSHYLKSGVKQMHVLMNGSVGKIVAALLLEMTCRNTITDNIKKLSFYRPV